MFEGSDSSSRLSGKKEGGGDGGGENYGYDCERRDAGDGEVVAGDHFCADENYDGGEALVEEAETREDIGEGEIERAQAEDGEDVRRIDDEGVARDG